MGVKYFYPWLKRVCPDCILDYKTVVSYTSKSKSVLLIDLNSIVHNCCAKVWKYGDYTENEGLLVKKDPPLYNEENINLSYEEVCKKIDEIVALFPYDKVMISLDGVAPMSKQNQQKQRRFLSAYENTTIVSDSDNGGGSICNFDRCNITPGTDYLKGLSAYIRTYIPNGIDTFIFSDEMKEGEGEHKLAAYARTLPHDWVKCFVGIDADLILICLASIRNAYVAREEMYYSNRVKNPYNIVDIERFTLFLTERNIDIQNFVMSTFILGNDFLPQVPFFELSNDEFNALDQLLIVLPSNEFNENSSNDTFIKVLKELSQKELSNFQKKWEYRKEYFHDELLDRCWGLGSIDNSVAAGREIGEAELIRYKEEYYRQKVILMFNEKVNDVCKEYIKGIQWIYEYYTKGVTNWSWKYPYNYAPFLSDIVSFSYTPTIFPENKPHDVYEQLINVLPYSSRNLLPLHLRNMVYDDITVSTDLAGKKNTYEAVVIFETCW